MIELAVPTYVIQWPSSDMVLLPGSQIVGADDVAPALPDNGIEVGFQQPEAARPTVLHEVHHDQYDGASGVLNGDDPWLDVDWARAEHSSKWIVNYDGGSPEGGHGNAVARPDHEPAASGADTSSAARSQQTQMPSGHSGVASTGVASSKVPNVQAPESTSYYHVHPLPYATGGHETAETAAGVGGASASTANSCFKYDDL